MNGAHRQLPENTSIIIPRLVCRDPAAEVAFCVRALDAVSLTERPGPDGTLAHALLKIGPEMIMIEAEWPSLPSRAPAMDATSPVVIFVSGHVWTVATRIERTTSDERTQRWSAELDQLRSEQGTRRDER